MKKLFLLICVIASVTSYGQTFPKFTDPTVYGKKENRFLPLLLQGLPNDTIQPPRTPEDLSIYYWVSVKNGNPYLYNPLTKFWIPFPGAGGAGTGIIESVFGRTTPAIEAQASDYAAFYPSLTGYNKVKWDSLYLRAFFDTSTRNLTLHRAFGAPTVLNIPGSSPQDITYLMQQINRIDSTISNSGSMVTGALDPIYIDNDGRIAIRYWMNIFRASHLHNRYVNPRQPGHRDVYTFDSLTNQIVPWSIDSLAEITQNEPDGSVWASRQWVSDNFVANQRFLDSTAAHWAAIMTKGTGNGSADSSITSITQIDSLTVRFTWSTGWMEDIVYPCPTCGGSGGTGGAYVSDITLDGSILKKVKQGITTNIASVTKFNWVNPQNGDYIVYQNGEVTNITPPIQSGGGGSGILGSDSTWVNDAGLFVKYGTWIKRIAFTDSTLAGGEPPGGEYDSDAVAYFTAEEAAGGVITSPQKAAWSAFVATTKGGLNTYAKIKVVYPFLGTGLRNAKAPGTFTATPVGGVTFGADGVTFDGSTGYLNTGLNTAQHYTAAAGNETIAVHIKSGTGQNQKAIVGAYNGGLGSFIFPKYDADMLLILQSSQSNIPNGTTDGTYVATHRANTETRVLKNGVQLINTTSTTVDKASLPFYIGGFNNAGGAQALNAATVGITLFIDGELSNAEMQELSDAIQTYITALNRQ